MEDKKIGVYIKLNNNKEIVDINSDIFIKDFTDWIKIDEGNGDKYAHAQSQYFENSLVNQLSDKYNYKYENKKVIENK